MKAKVVINESHRLLPMQLGLIEAQGWEAEIVGIPADGLDRDGQLRLAEELAAHEGYVVFVSPVPVLMARTAALAAVRAAMGIGGIGVYVMSNDRREAVEVGGKIVHRLHPDGWELVRIF